MLRVTDIKNNYSNCLVNEAVYLDAACQWFCVNVAEVVVCIQQQQQPLLLLLVHPFNGLFSTTTWVSRYHKGKTSLDLNEARDDGVLGRQWHQLDHMQTICTSLQTDNLTNT